MIICHSHKFIFIKTMKTAGTSLEIALAQACQSGDIIARIRPDEPALTYREFKHAQFKNHDTGKQLILRQHAPLVRAVQALGEKVLNYKIIVSERNPWNKLVSSFYWKLYQTPAQLFLDPSWENDFDALQAAFEKFVTYPHADPCDAFDMYSHSWVPLADYVIRFEHLKTDLAKVVTDLGLPKDVQLPAVAAKGFVRPQDSELAFSAEMNKAVACRFAREIAHFGYKSQTSKGIAFNPVDTDLAWRKKYWAANAEKGWHPA